MNWALWLLSPVKGVGEIPFSPPPFWGVPPAPLVPPVVALIADIGGGGGIGFCGSGWVIWGGSGGFCGADKRFDCGSGTVIWGIE